VCVASESAELACREFHTSMPISQSKVTEKYFLFLSSHKLYASSLLEKNEGETAFGKEGETTNDLNRSDQQNKSARIPSSVVFSHPNDGWSMSRSSA